MRPRVLAVLIIFTAASLAWKCGANKAADPGLPVPIPASFSLTLRTPLGAAVHSNVDVPPDVLELVDAGLEHQLVRTRAAFPDWQHYRSAAQYEVMLIDPQATNLDGSPALLYNGTIQTAGTMLPLADGLGDRPVIVLPHQAGSAWQFRDYFMRSVWYESEHAAEFANDRSLFYQYANANDVHPHWKLPNE